MAEEIKLPRQGQSVESCIITKLYFKRGDKVSKGDILFSYETDKAAFDYESDHEGVLLKWLCEEGDEVPVLQTVCVVGEEGEELPDGRGFAIHGEGVDSKKGVDYKSTPSVQAKSTPSVQAKSTPSDQAKSTPSDQAKSAPAERSEGGKISPRARRMAEEKGIDISGIKGSGPGGRIIVRDLEDMKSADYTEEPLSNIRKIIARSMHESLKNSAQLTHHLGADARKILGIRKKIKENEGADDFVNITINDLVCFAVIKALQKHKRINSHLHGDTLRIFNNINLGVAVDTERGLMVPVISNADSLSIEELSKKAKDLSDKCRTGDIDPDIIKPEAASFTVSNLGNYGVEMFTPVINLPQTGILGVNTILQRPVDQDGTIEFVPYLGLSLTYDHRAVDGAEATRFLKQTATEIENLEIK